MTIPEPLPAIQGNDKIKEKILSGEPFIASKIGAVERTILSDKIQLNAYTTATKFFASNNAGVSPSDDNTLDFFFECYSTALGHVEFLGSMDSYDEIVVIEKFASQAEFFELRFLEPFYFENPWSEALAGKKVLVIHPFEEDIINQYAKKESIFENQKILPEFDLKTIKSVQTNGGGLSSSRDDMNFAAGVEHMTKMMDEIDYDIAIIGCGAYGLILADYALFQRKQAIHIGGGLQIMFGIKGKRWDAHSDVGPMYNEHWCRPDSATKPVKFNDIEGGTYW